jgi:hypothetical protein
VRQAAPAASWCEGGWRPPREANGAVIPSCRYRRSSLERSASLPSLLGLPSRVRMWLDLDRQATHICTPAAQRPPRGESPKRRKADSNPRSITGRTPKTHSGRVAGLIRDRARLHHVTAYTLTTTGVASQHLPPVHQRRSVEQVGKVVAMLAPKLPWTSSKRSDLSNLVVRFSRHYGNPAVPRRAEQTPSMPVGFAVANRSRCSPCSGSPKGAHHDGQIRKSAAGAA